MLKHSLLSDGLFHVTGADGSVACLSLPQTLARLSAGEDLGFSALRPHQRPAWHAFLVQLAFLALEGQDEPALPTTPGAWAQQLRGLTPGYDDDAPWCLVNSNWQSPAFLQAPCSAAHEADFKESETSVQAYDILDTARNHDEKTEKLPLLRDSLDVAVYGLVSLQGWAAYGGRNLYQTMRMNGGVSSRPQFRLVFSRGAGEEFKRDLNVLLERRDELIDKAKDAAIGTGTDDPHRLLWLVEWNSGSIPVANVHPLCLEVSRRVRMIEKPGGLTLRRAGSDAVRIDAASYAGCVLDPWVPIVQGDPPKSLTAQVDTLGFRRLRQLLFDPTHTRLPLLARMSESERLRNESAVLLAQVVVRVKRGTEGLQRREIAVPARVLARWNSDETILAQRSESFAVIASQAAGDIYAGALMRYVGNDDKPSWKNRDFTRAVEPWSARFEQAVDEIFFSTLFHTLENQLDDTQAQRLWVLTLQPMAQRLLHEATESLPTRDKSRWFAQVRAERFMRLAWHKQFGALLALPQPPDAVPAPTDQEPAHE